MNWLLFVVAILLFVGVLVLAAVAHQHVDYWRLQKRIQKQQEEASRQTYLQRVDTFYKHRRDYRG